MLPAGMFVFQLLFVTPGALFRNRRQPERKKKKDERKERELRNNTVRKARLNLSSFSTFVLID